MASPLSFLWRSGGSNLNSSFTVEWSSNLNNRERCGVRHTRWLNDEEKRAWTAFTTAHALLYRRLEQRLKRRHGLSGLRYEILVRLSGAPDREMRMAELAGALVNSKSGLTYQIGQLQKSGLVRRRT